jgi:hypothetical protein
VRDFDGTIVAKWAEKYFFDSTPNQFERTWENPEHRWKHYHWNSTIPVVPTEGYCEYKEPDTLTTEKRYYLQYQAYTRRKAEERRREWEADRRR